MQGTSLRCSCCAAPQRQVIRASVKESMVLVLAPGQGVRQRNTMVLMQVRRRYSVVKHY
jgi:hypothetical protein